MFKFHKFILIILTGLLGLMNFIAYTAERLECKATKEGNYKVLYVNLDESKMYKGKNKVKGVVLHHTAISTINKSLGTLTNKKIPVSCHTLIDRDGTRYVLAEPERITKHAGYSYLNGREKVSEFTIGIEFQSVDTHIQPLTDKQIESAIDYLLPIIKKYKIPLTNIVTHEQVRDNWLKRHPDRKDVETKADISTDDYQRFMTELKKRLKK